MNFIKNKVPGAMTILELRDTGYEYEATPETAFGIKKVLNKDGRSETKKVLVLPPDFVIDRFNFTTLDVSHVDYKKKVH